MQKFNTFFLFSFKVSWGNFDGFGACFVVPEVVQTILHFGNTVAVLILAKNVLLLFVRKIHEVKVSAGVSGQGVIPDTPFVIH